MFQHPEIAARLESVKTSIRNELALQNAQELMSVSNVTHVVAQPMVSPSSYEQKVNDKCYAKCVPKPGTSLSSSEEVCVCSSPTRADRDSPA